jgi:hypothetical protein
MSLQYLSKAICNNNILNNNGLVVERIVEGEYEETDFGSTQWIVYARCGMW